MKIGIDARMYGDSVTGIGIYTKNLIENLLALDSNNEYVIFLLPENFDKFQSSHPNVKKVKVDIPWYSWAEQIKLPKIIKKENLDLMHFAHFNVPILYLKEFVVTIHDITPKFFPGPRVKKSIVRKIGFWLVYRLGVIRAQKIFAVSTHTKNHLIEYFKIDSNKIKVVYNGLNKNLQPIDDYGIIKQLKEKYNIKEPFIFYLGVWRDHKNLPGLIKAFDILLKKYKLDINLVLGGQENIDYPNIRQTWEQLKLGEKIIRPGFIENRELPFFYQEAKCFVLPSFNEGFGLVALESISLGTPVAASKTTSLPEILGDSALYFNPYDPQDIAKVINQILSDENISKKSVSLGQKRIKEYSWEKTAQNVLKTYEEVIKK